MFFNFFKKKKRCLTEREIKWNLLWQKYADGALDADYFVLCDYHAGVNGGGHYCFFDNKEQYLEQYAASLKRLLPTEFFAEFDKAYSAYVSDADAEKICDEADGYFYKNEQVVTDILQEYANSLRE
ncbi:MAG: hypothetical protein NC099_06085 [Corallococcus sp.]|nr:hypothetical protein [Bacillota bacterium]MCM1534202.1 hypothetical protein [Corallococcus sp.]